MKRRASKVAGASKLQLRTGAGRANRGAGILPVFHRSMGRMRMPPKEAPAPPPGPPGAVLAQVRQTPFGLCFGYRFVNRFAPLFLSLGQDGDWRSRGKASPASPLFLGLLLLLFLLTSPSFALDRITLSPDGKSFTTASGKSFTPWGVNYGNAGRLMEDFWEKEWATIESDFREIRAMGGNVVRVHLQFGKFMEAADRLNAASLQKLRDLLSLAEKNSLYLDLTGLACYRTADVPPWYDALDDKARWAAQAAFWRAIAETCNGHPAVFCYDLMNEPISPGEKGTKWYSGSTFGGYDFIQFIARDPAGRARMEIAAAWIDQLTAAIREKDKSTLITVGLLPWVTGWQHLSGFLPAEVARHVDFLSVHIYPKTKEPAEAPRALKECAVGKPVVIEETFPLECTVEELEKFLRDSRSTASGWIWHYDGTPVVEYDAMEKIAPLPIDKSIWRGALRAFERLQPDFAAPAPAPNR